MIAKWLEMLAGFIVDKFCEKVGVNDAADLEALIGRLVKAELPDLAVLDALPGQIVAAVVPAVANIPAQVLAAIKGMIPLFGR